MPNKIEEEILIPCLPALSVDGQMPSNGSDNGSKGSLGSGIGMRADAGVVIAAKEDEGGLKQERRWTNGSTLSCSLIDIPMM